MNPKICLLLVENNPGDIRLIMEMLKETKKVEFDITNSAKLDESLKLLDEKQFEVILLDLGLPDSQGLDTFKKVRSHAPGLPVVILTGLDDESLALQAIKAGSQDYLTKNTMNSELLVRAIQYAIERKQAEEEINRMAKILDIAPNSITIHDFNGNFIYANQKTFVLHGYTRDEFFALPLGKLDTPDTAKLIPDRMKEISEKGEANFQVEHIRKDGSIFPMEVSVQLTKWGDTNAILSIATDITELKKAELAVEERLKEIICLYGISKIIETSGISLEEIFRRIVRLVPASWQYSEIAVCRIIVDEVEYKEPNFKKTDWMQSSEIKVAGKNVGIIEIYYLEKKSDLDEGPFLKEERLVLDAVAERIGSIFERKQVEEALKQSEHNYRMLFDNMSEGIFVLDAETQKVVLSNKAIAKIYGFDSDADTVNINPIDFILPEDKEAVYKIIAEDMFKNDLQQINEFRSLTKDGREIWISAVGVRTNYKGRLAGLISISEITERKQAEEELRFLIAGIKQSSEGIAISDLDGNLRFVNRAFAIMHGFKETDLIGKNLSTFHNPEQIPSVESANRQIQETGEFAGEIWHTRIDGTVFLAAMHSSLLRDEAGTPAGMVATLRDITKRKKMEEELSIAKKRLKIANSILRHDVTNDLVVIKSALDIYQDQNDKTMLGEIEKRVEKSLKRINMHREHENFVESYKELEEYDLVTVLNEVTQNYPGIKIAISGTGEVYADNAISSVFENIINNAIKHGDTKKIDIEIDEKEEYYEIRIKDYGICIPENIKDKIFDDGFHYGKKGHTGIGLYNTEKTIENYDGEIEVADNKPKGTIIIIRLRKIIKR